MTANNSLVQRLHEEEGLYLGLCGETLELLMAVLFGEEKKQTKNNCKNCGKGLQDGWKVCPYCGKIRKKNICKNCEKEMQEEWRACPHCGTLVNSAIATVKKPVVKKPAAAKKPAVEKPVEVKTWGDF